MEQAKGNRIKFSKSDSPGKSAAGILQGAVTFLLSSPAMIFIIAIVVVLFKSLQLYKSYCVDIDWINRGATVMGLIALAVCFLSSRSGSGRGTAVFRNPTVLFFLALVGWMLLSTWHNGVTEAVIAGSFYRCEPLSCFLIYPMIYYFVSSLIGSETAKRRLINCFLAVELLLAAATFLSIIAEACGFDRLASFTFALRDIGVVGIYYNSNHYAYTLVIAIALSGAMFVSAEKRALRIFYLVSFAFLTAILVLNDTFGAYLAVLASILFLIALYAIRDKKANRKTFVLLGVFFVVSVVVNFRMVFMNIFTLFTDMKNIFTFAPEADQAGSRRWKLWRYTVQMIAERPLLGHGVEGIAERLMAKAGNDRPHNEFLQYAVFFGIPALIFYVSAVASVFLRFLRRKLQASPCTVAALTAAFGYLASSFFGNTMYYTAPLFFIVLGLADTYAEKYQYRNEV